MRTKILSAGKWQHIMVKHTLSFYAGLNTQHLCHTHTHASINTHIIHFYLFQSLTGQTDDLCDQTDLSSQISWEKNLLSHGRFFCMGSSQGQNRTQWRVRGHAELSEIISCEWCDWSNEKHFLQRDPSVSISPHHMTLSQSAGSAITGHSWGLGLTCSQRLLTHRVMLANSFNNVRRLNYSNMMKSKLRCSEDTSRMSF